MKIIVPLAEGFEEIEAVSIVDVLRRAGLEVATASLTSNPVKGSHNIPILADSIIGELRPVDFNCIILPGGMPGAENLKKSDTVLSYIKHIFSKGGYVGAICAAPIVLAHAGILYGKRVTSFPGYEPELEGAKFTGAPIEVDGTVITGRGPGCAVQFALEIVRILSGEKLMAELRKNMQVI